MKTKLVPGIFIPYILVDLSSSEFDAIENHVENLLANNKLRLQKFLENCGGYVLQDACMVCDEVVYLGLFFKPEQPHQMTYGQVWNIVKTNAGIDALREKGYTVPLNSVAAAKIRTMAAQSSGRVSALRPQILATSSPTRSTWVPSGVTMRRA